MQAKSPPPPTLKAPPSSQCCVLNRLQLCAVAGGQDAAQVGGLHEPNITYEQEEAGVRDMHRRARPDGRATPKDAAECGRVQPPHNRPPLTPTPALPHSPSLCLCVMQASIVMSTRLFTPCVSAAADAR